MLIEPSDGTEAEAFARHEWAQAKALLRMAQREADAARPQQWMIGDWKRHARRHVENWIAYRKLAAMQRARAMRVAAE